MSILEAIVLGLIQGLTEFIPVSSTAHLTLAGKWMNLIDPQHPDQWTAFIAVIQLGTLAAVVAYFWSDLIEIIVGFITANLAALSGRAADESAKQHAKLGWLLIVGTLPVAIVGLLFRHQIEGMLTKDLRVIAGSLIGLAIVLTVAEIVGRQRRDINNIKTPDAIIVGIAQVFALIPGSSRSGTTITGGLFSGLERATAARFSFLLSIPAVAASGLFELPKALHSLNTSWTEIAIAGVVSAVTGYASIAFLLRYLQRHTTYIFVAYRIALGLLLIWLLVSGRVLPR
ncbi:MAG TPA: undecaprenyl-diphosphatase UppP [Blastocatellia bacterium]|nr:undecaprenyl-diphosphatase UppP [Blastocatellia bacterium]